ncbi:hypothetical protein [Chachezhania sediminis]|uniref:hypothetical protein n=1 Tax=Chachezhania sediminis TaxID=2599291 RepID=UPI001E5C73D3|nr:hypothetical protein [Chachezhania sediminis]
MTDDAPQSTSQSISQPTSPRDSALGITAATTRREVASWRALAFAFSVLWLGLCGGFLLLTDVAWRESFAGLGFVVAVLAAVMPLGGIWVLMAMARAQEEIRRDSHKLQEALATIRQTAIAQQQRQSAGLESKLARKLDDMIDRLDRVELMLIEATTPEDIAPEFSVATAPAAAPAPVAVDAPSLPAGDDIAPDEDDEAMHAALDAAESGLLARLTDVSDPAPPADGAEDAPEGRLDQLPEEPDATAPARETDALQGALAFDLPEVARPPRPAASDYVRALNFPETADDKEGFGALRRAMRDRQTAQMIQSAEDVLTLLSQEGVYMDDLRPDQARPETWRLFAKGVRGRAVADLGGIHDRELLARITLKMRQDTIFRDSAHHFLRLFDRAAAEFEPGASDAEMAAFGDTRTARAFMLLARVAGTFD